ncbi:MAG: class I SAM-dependent methyltransferase, partial [Nanoarchaeota archaeon]
MSKIFGSENKTKIIFLLSAKSNLSAKQISETTNIPYKNVFKILKELELQEIISIKNLKYNLNFNFIENLKRLVENSVSNYTSMHIFRNRLYFLNVLSSLKDSKELKNKLESEIDDYLLKKLDDWYSKFYDFENIEKKKILQIIKNSNLTSGKILEVGAGTGRMSKYLNQNFKNVLSIDKSEKYINYCKHKFPDFNFKVEDILNFNTKEKFDIIIFSWIGFHYFENKENFLSKIKRMLTKNG